MASRTVRSGRASTKNAAVRAQPSGNGSSTKRTASVVASRGLDLLSLEVRSLKKLLLFHKAKQHLLASSIIGSEQVDRLLADYLKVVLTLTGTSAGSILLPDQDRLVFRAAAGAEDRAQMTEHR